MSNMIKENKVESYFEFSKKERKLNESQDNSIEGLNDSIGNFEKVDRHIHYDAHLSRFVVYITNFSEQPKASMLLNNLNFVSNFDSIADVERHLNNIQKGKQPDSKYTNGYLKGDYLKYVIIVDIVLKETYVYELKK